MAGGEVIKEFLVSVNYQIDEGGEKKFRDNMRTASLQANLLADAIKATVKLVWDMSAAFAKAMDEMYFKSQRVNSAAENIKALGYAASQTGSSVDEASAAVDTLAKKLRDQPGLKSLIKSWGIDPNQDTSKMMMQLAAKLNKMPTYIRNQYADMLGIPEKLVMALASPQAQAEFKKQIEILGRYKISLDELTRGSNEFKTAMRNVWMEVEALAMSVYRQLLPGMKEFAETIRRFLETNGKALERVLVEIAKLVVDVAEAIGGVFKAAWVSVFPDLDSADKALNAIADALKSIREWTVWVIDSITSLIKKLNELDAKFGTSLFRYLIPGYGLKQGLGTMMDPGGTASGVWEGIKSFFSFSSAKAAEANGGGSFSFGGGGASGRRRPGEGSIPEGGAAGANGGSARPAQRAQMMAWAMDQLRKEGVPEGNLRAAAAHLVGQADMESGLHPGKSHDGGTGFGIYGARLDRWRKMWAWMEKNGFGKTSAEGQIREMVHSAMNGGYKNTRRILMNANENSFDRDTPIITREFENPARVNYRTGAVRNAFRTGPVLAPRPEPAQAPAAGARGLSPMSAVTGAPLAGPPANAASRSVSVTSSPTITISGVTDPTVASALVGQTQERIARDLLRNSQGAAQ